MEFLNLLKPVKRNSGAHFHQTLTQSLMAHSNQGLLLSFHYCPPICKPRLLKSSERANFGSGSQTLEWNHCRKEMEQVKEAEIFKGELQFCGSL